MLITSPTTTEINTCSHTLSVHDALPISLTFDEPDYNTFNCLSSAITAIQKGGAYPCYVNAANEEAVSAFLNNKIGFLKIGDIVSATLTELKNIEIKTFEDVLKAEKIAREFALSKV